MIIETDKLLQTSLNYKPYQWLQYENLFHPSNLQSLYEHFPKNGYELCEADREDKSYKMFHKLIYDNRKSDVILAEDLSPIWLTFINQLISKKYIQSLSQLTNINLSDHDIEINFWKYGNGCWLSSHTDKPNKVLSQLFYFNPMWEEKWGGAFRVLNSFNINDYHTEIFPKLGNSIILVRSDNSWHAVAKQISPNHIYRQVLQLVFWRPSPGTVFI